MKKEQKENFSTKTKGNCVGKLRLLFGLLLCLFAGILTDTKVQAESQEIVLGTQLYEDIEVKLGDTLNFSLNITDELSMYYSIRDQIATVAYYVEYDFEEVLTAETDTTFQVTGLGSTYLNVVVRNIYGEDISEHSYRIVSVVNMENVTLAETSIKGYRYGNTYAYQTFSVNVNGLEGVNSYDINFSYTSSNEEMYVYCNFDAGQISIGTLGAGDTQLTFTINEKTFLLNLTIKQVDLSCGNSLLLVEKATKQLKVKGISEKVTWESTNPKVLTISKNGKIKAKKKGNAVIIASVGTGKLGCAVSVVTKARKKVIARANKIGKNWKYSQAKRMQEGYYDCSSLVWKAYKLENKYFGMKYYAPVSADVGKWCAQHKKMVKGNAQKNIQNMKYRPGALTFKTGSGNGRYKGIYHVEMFVGYTFEGFDSDGKPVLGTKWAARADNYYYGELWAQP